MKPYYQDEAVTIYHGDCMQILPVLQPVDLVLADPPYNGVNIGPNQRTYCEGRMQLPDEEYQEFCAKWFNLANLLAPNIVVTPGIANLWSYPKAKWVLCWHKPSAISFNKFGGFNAWEPILVYGKAKGRFGQDYIRQDPLNFSKGPERHHPCPKPEKVWDWLIMGMTEEGDTIIDPFLGAGTTCWCAKKFGRKAIGIEIVESYCEIAATRCSQMVMSLRV